MDQQNTICCLKRIADKYKAEAELWARMCARQWIDANKEPPPLGVRVLARGKRGGVFICKRTFEDAPVGKRDGNGTYCEFTQWMPLPQ